MGDVPLFSVVICTHDRAERLPTAMASVLAQTFEDLELVVVDDGSTDGTRDAVGSFEDGRVRYVWRANGGLSAARNTGIDSARGRYVTFLDDDDGVDPEWLAVFADLVPDAAVVSCAARVLRDGRVITVGVDDLGPAFENYRGLFIAGSFAVRRDVLVDIGGFDEELQCSHQTELALRLLPACRAGGHPVACSDSAPVEVRMRSAAERERNDPERLRRCTERLMERHGERIHRSASMYADYCSIIAVCSARLGDIGDARRWFGRAVLRQPTRPRNTMRWGLTLVPPLARRRWPPAGS